MEFVFETISLDQRTNIEYESAMKVRF